MKPLCPDPPNHYVNPDPKHQIGRNIPVTDCKDCTLLNCPYLREKHGRLSLLKVRP
jgi:hypothetical protein